MIIINSGGILRIECIPFLASTAQKYDQENRVSAIKNGIEEHAEKEEIMLDMVARALKTGK